MSRWQCQKGDPVLCATRGRTRWLQGTCPASSQGCPKVPPARGQGERGSGSSTSHCQSAGKQFLGGMCRAGDWNHTGINAQHHPKGWWDQASLQHLSRKGLEMNYGLSPAADSALAAEEHDRNLPLMITDLQTGEGGRKPDPT